MARRARDAGVHAWMRERRVVTFETKAIIASVAGLAYAFFPGIHDHPQRRYHAVAYWIALALWVLAAYLHARSRV